VPRDSEYQQFCEHMCTRAMLSYFQKRKGQGTPCGALQDVHTIAQNDLLIQGALEGTQTFHDKLPKRIGPQNMKEVVCDLDSFGIPVYISGDSLLVVSWLEGVWRVLTRAYQD